MPDMREPYAFIACEAENYEFKAVEARKEAQRLNAISIVYQHAA